MSILLIIGIILAVLWIFGLVSGFVLNGLIHIALIVGAILIIIWLLKAVFNLF